MRRERDNFRFQPYQQRNYSNFNTQGRFSNFRGGQSRRPFNQFRNDTSRGGYGNNRGYNSGFNRNFRGNNFRNRPMNGGFNRQSGNYSN